MQGYINRKLEKKLDKYREIFPVTAIVGPRQCGKSSMIRYYKSKVPDSLYLDLESQSDFQKISADPEWFFLNNQDKTIFIDEIQLLRNVFPIIRSVVDKNQRKGWIVLLGSASPDLLKQSSESLAGRIGYLELTPFLFSEIWQRKDYDLQSHWLKGGYPRSYLQTSAYSYEWRENFIKTFIERDIPALDIRIPAQTLKRFLTMVAHYHGHVLNYSEIGNSLGVSHHTVRNYIDIFEHTFILRTLQPYLPNLKKRLIKSPKLYLRDMGILHNFLQINSFNDLMGNPVFGYSWEGFALENIISELSGWNFYYLRTRSGVEIDLILQKGSRLVTIEFKGSLAPKLSKGFFLATENLEINESWIIAPINDYYKMKPGINVSGLWQFFNKFER